MYLYIAHRNLREYFERNTCCGGSPYNNDYKFTDIKDGMYYLLTKYGTNYAVSKEDGDRFVEEVKSKCTDEHPGSFPLIRSLNGKDTAAVVMMDRDVDLGGYISNRTFHYDMDDDLLLQMLEDLRARCGEPLDARALMNYCYPNPTLPEGDFQLNEIYHGIYCKPDNTPNSVIRNYFPDKKAGYLLINEHGAFLQMRVEDNNVMSNVPAELIPEIKEKVRLLCEDPKEAFVEHGEWEGYIRFGEDDERIFTDPEKTLELLEEIASKSVYDKTEAVDTKKYVPVGNVPNGGFGIGMMGFMGMAGFAMNSAPTDNSVSTSNVTTQTNAGNGKKCVFCGADVTGKKFCTECGTEVKQ